MTVDTLKSKINRGGTPWSSAPVWALEGASPQQQGSLTVPHTEGEGPHRAFLRLATTVSSVKALF